VEFKLEMWGQMLRSCGLQKNTAPLWKWRRRARPSKPNLAISTGQVQAFFVYQSGVDRCKVAHFSGRSSSAKMAVTGQTGTQAPQSMHSTGLM